MTVNLDNYKEKLSWQRKQVLTRRSSHDRETCIKDGKMSNRAHVHVLRKGKSDDIKYRH